MFGKVRLSYLVLEARDLARWRRFAGEFLGLPEPVVNGDGSIGYRIDDQAQRLVLAQGPADDVAALGWEADSVGVADAICARAAAAGATPALGTAAEAAARRVAELRRFTDPQGVVNEIVLAPARADTPFRSTGFPGGFLTGDLGFGHAVMIARDLARIERFYTDVFGLKVSQRLETSLGPITAKGAFLYSNPRNHSLALFDMPVHRRLQHFMLEANALKDVGAAWERAKRLKVPVTLDLGQHPEPDGTVSFYGRTPSGFDFEIGAGAGLIDEDFQAVNLNVTSGWGHHPSLAMRLRMMGSYLGERLGLAAPR
jgi:biphenyl-2,3-diol 1,2-dioxygenase